MIRGGREACFTRGELQSVVSQELELVAIYNRGCR